MPRTNVRCPECDERVRVEVSPGRTSVRCPECGARVPLEDEDDEREDDDRPRRKKKRRREQGDGPWLLAAGVAALGFVMTFAGALVVKGAEGLAPGEDGPAGKLFGLGFCFLVSLVLIPLGVVGVKNRTAYGRWGMEVSGNMGVVLGMIQAAAGGLLGGFALYGVLFTLIRGH